MDHYTPSADELRQFYRIKAGIMNENPASPPQKKLYTLFYKNNEVPGFVNKEYTLIKWKYGKMIEKGEATKAFLEIRCTKAVKKIG